MLAQQIQGILMTGKQPQLQYHHSKHPNKSIENKFQCKHIIYACILEVNDIQVNNIKGRN